MIKTAESVLLSLNREDYLLDIRRSWWRNQDTDLVLVSGSKSVEVHRAVLLPLSQFLAGLVPASCPCIKPIMILPPEIQDVLPGLVELLYFGSSVVNSLDAEDTVRDILALLQIDVDVCMTGLQDFHGVAPLEQSVEELEVMLQDQHHPMHQDQHQPMLQDQHQPILQDHHQPILQDQHQLMLQDQHQPILQDHHQPILQDHHQPMLQDQHQPILQDHHQPILQDQHQPILQDQRQPPTCGSVYREHFNVTGDDSDRPVVFNADESTMENESFPLMGREKSVETANSKPTNMKRVSLRVVTQLEKKQVMNGMDESGMEKREFRKRRKEYSDNNPTGFYLDGSALEEGIIPMTDLPSMSWKQPGGETICRDKGRNRKRRIGNTPRATSLGKKKTQGIKDEAPGKASLPNESSKREKYVKVVATNGSHEDDEIFDSTGGVYMDGSFPGKGIIPIIDLPRLSAKSKKNQVAQNKRMKCQIIEYSRNNNDVCYDELEEIEEIPRRDDEYSRNGIKITDFKCSITITRRFASQKKL